MPCLRVRQRGAALLLFALIGMILGIGLFFSVVRNPDRNERVTITHDTLAQAKAALIGYAATYRDVHPDESFGYLPCPDTDNDGVAEANCGATDESVIGRLPWKTLGLPPQRDADNECLWYAVSGRAKNNPKTASYNWDTLGQFIVQDKSGNTLAGATPHDRPFALIFSAGAPLGAQSHATVGTPDCGGNSTATNYLEDVGALSTGNTTVQLATPASIADGSNNDRAVWITGKDIFDVVRKRTDFKTAVEALLADTANCVNNFTPATLGSTALEPSGAKGADKLVTFLTTAANNCATYATAGSAQRNFLDNWKDNLLYARMSAADVTNPTRMFSAGGGTACKAVAVFGGERGATQLRHDAGTMGTLANYLETPGLLATFPASFVVTNGAALGGASVFTASTPADDLASCITGLPAGATQVSFTTDFPSFATDGATGAASADSGAQTATLLDASGSTGGCFWYRAAPIALAGKTLRSYYRFQFAFGDDPAVPPNLRYGFALQMLRGDLGPPSGCGDEVDSGVLGPTATTSAPNTWGSRSFIVETDIYQTAGAPRYDPPGNHTAILKNGSLSHSPLPAIADRQSCGGLWPICERVPYNRFEETPTPSIHNQRMEIVTGCPVGCAPLSSCNPAAHDAPNTYASIAVWVDCTSCDDIASPLDRTAKPPTIQRCEDLDVSMNRFYFGFTGGFSSTYPNAVTIRDFVLRTE